jgi:hypothetical protein
MIAASPLLLVGLIASSEALIRFVVVPNDSYGAYVERLMSPTTPDAVFGDSHTLRIVGIPGFVNLSRGGDSVRTRESKIRRFYLNQTPGRVVLEADPNQFAPGYGDTTAYDQPDPFEPTATRLYVVSAQYRGFVLDYWRRFLLRKGFDSSFIEYEDGALTQTSIWPHDFPTEAQQERVATRTVEEHAPVENLAASAAGASYRRTVEYLASAGAELCLVVMPQTAAYTTLAADHPTFAEARAYVAQIAHEAGVRFVDLSNDFADQSLFGDENHLNDVGGHIAGSLINERCFAPAVLP